MLPILPDAPSRTDPVNFSAKADAWVAALPAWTEAANLLEQSLQLVSTTGTSTTSKTIANGSWTLTTQASKAWVVGCYLYFASSSDPTKVMTGQVTAYNSSTGSLTVNITVVRGSGTYADWVIGLAVPDQAALNLSGGSGGSIPYQSGANTTDMLAAGSVGQVLQSNGSSAPSWINYPKGSLIGVQIFSTVGSFVYTATAGTNRQILEICGGGGGSGGAPATTAGQVAVGRSGGSGAYLKILTASNWNGATVTVGTGGAGASPGGNGSDGGASIVIFGSYLYDARGGSGGTTIAATSTLPFGISSAASGNTVLTPAPGDKTLDNVYSYGPNTSSPGAASSLSLVIIPRAPGSPISKTSNGITVCTGSGAWTGDFSTGYGAAGAANANVGSGAVNQAGNAGSSGVVIIYEYA